MPLTWDQVGAISEKKFLPKLYDNVFDSNPIVQRLKKNSYNKLDGGTSIMVPLNYATTTSSAWYSGADVLDTTDNQNITSAEYQWKQIYANVSINRMEELKNSGDAGKVNLAKSKFQIAEKTIIDSMGTGIYSSGTDPKSIVGFGTILGTSNTVGGISQTNYSWWRAQVDSTTTALTIAAMQSRFNLCTVNNDSPTVIATTRTLYNSYYALLQPQQRFQDSESAKGGWSSLFFNQTPVIADSHATASLMAFLNESYLELFVHKDEDMRFSGYQKPINQNIRVGQIFWAGALGSSNNRLHGALTAVTA